ncbi:OmpA family protein [Luteibaculum oceani]|uniref:OmpA family protein n=1 Tax=Luteibaculum oceani TaxID=1294296 RepID=A0A5C6V9Y2_9FLAO|nr:OmpA family protein [Luteibaculum oceani]TXC81640.1 OmpA family protein [Luteibaculum oceani]
MKNLLGLIPLLFLGFSLLGQSKATVKANELFEQEAYQEAVQAYREAFLKEPSPVQKARIVFQIAECYRLVNDTENAKDWYQKSIKAKHNDPMHYYHLGTMLLKEQKYKEAIEQFENFQSAEPNSVLGANGIKSAKAAMEWGDKPTRWVVTNEEVINSSSMDMDPSFLDKRNTTLVFTSSREGSTGKDIDVRTGENFQDLWFTEKDRKGRWSEPALLDPTINTEVNEGSAELNAKRNTIYFTRCPIEKKEKVGCNVMKATYVGGKVSNITKVELKKEGQEKFTVGQPTVDKKEEVLVFSSDLEGGQGGNDLWMIVYDKKAKEWSEPKNLGPKINTPGEELFPFLHDDGSLYFSSDGHVGMGGLDIFVSQSIGEFRWGDPENLKAPMNSSFDDYGIVFNKTKKEGFFSSNREGGRGKDDIYSFYYPPMVFALQGTVMDRESGQPIEGVTVEVTGSDGSAFSAITDAMGSYAFGENGLQRYINEDVNYSISVRKQDYLIAKDRISTVGAQESMTFVLDFLLQFSPPNKAIELPEVLYELDKATLLPQSKDSLDFLYKILVDNPTAVIELRAHTDSRGDDKYNMELSQRRAQSCIDYLVSKGIARDRMVAKGFGETDPRITDEEIKYYPTDEAKELAHQQNRRTEFVVLNFDYVPKDKIESGNK